MGPAASTSHVVDTDVSSSAMSRMVTSMLGSPSFLANDFMASRINLTHIFRLATMLCERGSVAATSAKVCEGVDVKPRVAEDVVVE